MLGPMVYDRLSMRQSLPPSQKQAGASIQQEENTAHSGMYRVGGMAQVQQKQVVGRGRRRVEGIER